MVFQRMKLLLSVCLLSGLLAGASVNATAVETYDNLPFYSLTVAVGEGQQEAFFAQLGKFAYSSGFADRIAPTIPGTGNFLITMWREDLKIYATNPFDLAEFRFSFYKNCGYPEIPSHFFDSWIGEFKKAINEVPATEITEEGPREQK